MRELSKRAVVPAPLFKVWEAFTTAKGVEAWGPGKARIELKVGGAYEWLFDLKAPVGQQGSEGCKVLSYLPMQMLSFSWNAPPTIPSVRALGDVAWIVVLLNPHGNHSVEVQIHHLGWRAGADWDKNYDYFDKAWGSVLESLMDHFGHESKAELAHEDEEALEEQHRHEDEEELDGE